MNDYELIINMFLKLKETNPKIDWACRESVDHEQIYIWLHRHKFTFTKEGELIDSQTSSELLDLD